MEEASKTSRIDEHTNATTLVEAVLAGCPRAEGEMCRRFERPMRRVLSRYADNPADAEDWLNSTWVIALPKIRRGDLREPESLIGFLCGVARRVAAGALRQRWRQDTNIGPDELETHGSQEDIYEAVSTGELIDLTEHLVEHLSVDRDREVLDRCFLVGDEKHEVAATLNLNATQLGKVLYRARRRLWDAAENAGVAASLQEVLQEAI